LSTPLNREISPTNFLARPEHILIGLFRAIFGQEELYEGLRNEFIYTRGGDFAIGMANDYNKELANAQQGIYIQPGGGNEMRRVLDGRVTFDWNFERTQFTKMVHNYMIHCVTRHMGTSQFLQSTVMRSIRSFTNVINEQGIDSIPAISFLPVQELSGGEGDRSFVGYDAVVSLTMSHDIDWVLVPDGDPEEIFEIQFQAAIEGGDNPIAMTIR